MGGPHLAGGSSQRTQKRNRTFPGPDWGRVADVAVIESETITTFLTQIVNLMASSWVDKRLNERIPAPDMAMTAFLRLRQLSISSNAAATTPRIDWEHDLPSIITLLFIIGIREGPELVLRTDQEPYMAVDDRTGGGMGDDVRVVHICIPRPLK